MSAATLLLLWTVALAAGSHVKTQHYNRRIPKAEFRFGLKLLRELSPAGHNGKRNILFSLAGISAAVGMVYAGAGVTRCSPGIANAALIDESFSVLDGYKKDRVRTFNGWLCSVDFTYSYNGVTSQINDWVKAKTNGMAPKMINEDMGMQKRPAASVERYLYFKGTWYYALDLSRGTLLPFCDYRSQTHPVETMRSVAKLSHVALRSPKSQAAKLRYRGGRCSLLLHKR
ncbi:intracellular coagulation inhibitor 1-like [Ixodes scapularis]|uniref:intracellular coagulation inhibitor 1-like n=1 Tax=Ixodes scapularis TaxID=6945 RepID=UPI001C386461|nr:intracellular coagulation inhibitor 1-like [Ixodes scapularis]